VNIRPDIQAMPLCAIQEMLTLLMADGLPTDESNSLFLKELLEQWRLNKNPTREE